MVSVVSYTMVAGPLLDIKFRSKQTIVRCTTRSRVRQRRCGTGDRLAIVYMHRRPLHQDYMGAARWRVRHRCRAWRWPSTTKAFFLQAPPQRRARTDQEAHANLSLLNLTRMGRAVIAAACLLTRFNIVLAMVAAEVFAKIWSAERRSLAVRKARCNTHTCRCRNRPRWPRRYHTRPPTRCNCGNANVQYQPVPLVGL